MKQTSEWRLNLVKVGLIITGMPVYSATVTWIWAIGLCDLSTRIQSSFAQCAWGMETGMLLGPEKTRVGQDFLPKWRGWLFVVSSSMQLCSVHFTVLSSLNISTERHHFYLPCLHCLQRCGRIAGNREGGHSPKLEIIAATNNVLKNKPSRSTVNVIYAPRPKLIGSAIRKSEIQFQIEESQPWVRIRWITKLNIVNLHEINSGMKVNYNGLFKMLFTRSIEGNIAGILCNCTPKRGQLRRSPSTVGGAKLHHLLSASLTDSQLLKECDYLPRV